MYVPSWQAWFGHIPNDAIDSIIKTCDTFPLQDALLGSDTEEYPGHTNDEWRRSKVAFIPPYMPETTLLTAGIASKANEANRNAWGFNIGPQIYDIQYTKYYGTDKGFYNWHIDTFFTNNSRAFDRKISVIIQLSDSDEYEGGDFKLDPEIEQPDPIQMRKKGTVIVFPSYLRHMVEPVTSGERKSIVSWIEGPRFV
jgi:PKHD-type hydroxylase